MNMWIVTKKSIFKNGIKLSNPLIKLSTKSWMIWFSNLYKNTISPNPSIKNLSNIYNQDFCTYKIITYKKSRKWLLINSNPLLIKMLPSLSKLWRMPHRMFNLMIKNKILSFKIFINSFCQSVITMISFSKTLLPFAKNINWKKLKYSTMIRNWFRNLIMSYKILKSNSDKAFIISNWRKYKKDVSKKLIKFKLLIVKLIIKINNWQHRDHQSLPNLCKPLNKKWPLSSNFMNNQKEMNWLRETNKMLKNKQ